MKAFFQVDPADISELRAFMGAQHGRAWKRANGAEHPPAIELHISNCYFAVTWQRLEDFPPELRVVPLETLQWLIEQAGPAFAGKAVQQQRQQAASSSSSSSTSSGTDDILARLDRAARSNRAVDTALRHATTMRGGSRSEGPMGLGCAVARAGWSYADMKAALLACPATKEWASEKQAAEGERQFERIWNEVQNNAPGGTAAAASANPSAFQVLTLNELLTREFPPREMVLAPWLPTKGLAMLYGPRGIGKTHVALRAAHAVATGGTFLRWHAPQPRRVLILDGEMPAEVLQSRLAEIVDAAVAEPPAPDYLRLLALDQQEDGLDLSDAADWPRLEDAIGEAEVILADNISSLVLGGRENEAESWLPVQDWALRQRRAGRSVVFVHHAGKGGQQRGTSRREDVLDTVLALRRSDDYQPDEGARFQVHYEKARGFHGEDAKPFEAALGASGWTMRDLADADMARVVALHKDGLSIRDIAAETGFSKGRVERMLAKARTSEPLPPGKGEG